MRAFIGLAMVLLGGSSCSSETESGRPCTAIGCTDGVHVSVLTGGLEDGDYTLRVTLDGQAYECKLSVPGDLPAPGTGQGFDCSPELRDALVMSRSSCDDAATCPPAGPLSLSFTPTGFPESVVVRLERDGETVAEGERSVEYHQIFPNGPDCDGGCKLAGVEFLFD
jgi:hypothetical protein